jgi:UDPglucose 6-dehydrogenase
LTEWNEFRALDLARVKDLLRAPLIIDLRNIYQPDEMTEAGFVYHSIGRSIAEPQAGTIRNLRVIA